MGRIDLPEVLEVLDQIAQEFPSRVDPRSRTRLGRYTSGGEPVCLVAVALHRLGFSAKSLALLDREHQGQAVEFAESKNPIAKRLTRDARAVLDRAQHLQDSGLTWSRSVDWATQRYRRRR